MRERHVRFRPRAVRDLLEIEDWIAKDSERAAERFVAQIEQWCRGLSTASHRGRPRDDILPGLRTITFRRRILVAYFVTDEAVRIIGIFAAGRDYETILREESDRL